MVQTGQLPDFIVFVSDFSPRAFDGRQVDIGQHQEGAMAA
jgi:hypothetical protein